MSRINELCTYSESLCAALEDENVNVGALELPLIMIEVTDRHVHGGGSLRSELVGMLRTTLNEYRRNNSQEALDAIKEQAQAYRNIVPKVHNNLG